MQTIKRFEFDASPETYWRHYLDREHQQAMYLEGLNSEFANELSRSGDYESGLTRVVHVRPRINAPKVIQKLFGSTREFTEEGRWDPETRIWSLNVTPSRQSKRITLKADLRAEPLDDGARCVVIYTIHVDVRLPLVAGAVERYIDKQFREKVEEQVAFTRKWLAERAA